MPRLLTESRTANENADARRRDTRLAVAISIGLVLAVFVTFSRTFSQGFLNYDDGYFVYDEPHVTSGLSPANLRWAFTSGPLGEWYPLSMVSHMIDCELYGVNPTGHHFTNLLLHALSAVVLFLVVWRMTGGLWGSAIVAALFALHPLHVESVVWISERRDVLSGLFFMLTLAAYLYYVRQPAVGRYLTVAGCLTLGLMAKPMLVSVPPLLLLLDYWPLERFTRGRAGSLATSNAGRLILEKVPLLLLALAAAGVTLFTHSRQFDPLTFGDRVANAFVSCVAYLGQFFVPVGLTVFYPYPEAGRPAWQVVGAVVLVLAISLWAVIGWRARPHVFVGWFWYLGMLVPVLGLTYIGAHSRADRYTYLAQIGLSIALVWEIARVAASWPARRWVLGSASAALVVALVAASWHQTGYWENDRTLWEHALDCDPHNVTVHQILGASLDGTDEEQAIAEYGKALELGEGERDLYPRVRAKAHNGLGMIASRRDKFAQAHAEYEKAIEVDPTFAPGYMNLGGLEAQLGNLAEAKKYFERSVELDPDSAPAAYCNLGMALAGDGKSAEAIESFEKALAFNRDFQIAHMQLGIELTKVDRIDEAIFHFEQAIKIDPNVAFPYYQIAQLRRKQGHNVDADKYQRLGVKTTRRFAEGENRRGLELANEGKLNQAIKRFETAIAVAPDYADAYCNLGDVLAREGHIEEAAERYRQAININPGFTRARVQLERMFSP